MKKLAVVILIVFYPFITILAQNLKNDLFSLSKIEEGVKSKRIGSYDKSGGNKDYLSQIKDGEKVTIMQVDGAGIINHIWITIAPLAEVLNRNDVIIRMYWDGNEFPSVESPIGPFFGNGWDESYNFESAPLTVSPTGGKSYVSYFPMPFSKGAKIEVENQSGIEIQLFFFNIDYWEMKRLPNSYGRFHAWYNHEATKVLRDKENKEEKNLDGEENYLFADIKGKGHFVGVNYYINHPENEWYGEGDEMIFIDGESKPSIIGTGTEDFFNTSWCPKEIFQHPYFGFARVNKGSGWLGRTHAYRFFITDPVYFDKSCKFTIEHGHNNNIPLDLASVAYWYQQKASALPKSFSKEERKPLPNLEVEIK